MLKQIKTLGIGLFLGVSLFVTGCSNVDKLTVTLTNLENRYYEIHDNMDEASETLDSVIIKETIEDFKSLQEDIKKEQSNYEEDEIEYKMFDEFNRTISYKIEGCELVLDLTDNILVAALDPTLEDKLNTITEGMNKAFETYKNYKDELGIKTNLINSSVNEEEEATEKEKATEKENTVNQSKYQYICFRCNEETLVNK